MVRKIDKNNPDRRMNQSTKSKSMAGSGSKTIKSTRKKNKMHAKRRGRRPKKIFKYTEINLDNPPEQYQSNPSLILRLNVKPDKINTTKNRAPDETILNNNTDIGSSEDIDIFRNDIPTDIKCHKCSKNEKIIIQLKSKLDRYEKQDKLDKSDKVYKTNLNFISIQTGKKVILKKTNIKCWWDTNQFNNLPFFLPEIYHKGVYHYIGCFCSLECSFAYNLFTLKDSKVHQRQSLALKLYSEMYDFNINEIKDIKVAPPKEILIEYGGTMDIKTFRKGFLMPNRERLICVPPVKPINVVVEERYIGQNADDDKNYTLKRSKPLTKKRSVISSMNLIIPDDDDD